MKKEKEPVGYDNLLYFKHIVNEFSSLIKTKKVLRSQILKALRTIDFDLQNFALYFYTKQRRGYVTDVKDGGLVDVGNRIISKYEGILKEKEIEIILSDGKSVKQ